MRRIAVIGSGYVGLGTGVVFAELGHQVTGVDIDAGKVARLQAGECPIFEPALDELLYSNVKSGRLNFTTDFGTALPDAEFVFICVNTPSGPNGRADMSYVRAAARAIGQHLSVQHHTVVVNKSTMPVGSGDLVDSLLRANANPEAGFSVVSNPEFLREGSAVADMLNPDRIVLGATNRAAAEAVAALYEQLDAPVFITDLRSAELIKYASNSFLATKIAFINEVARISEAVGADVRQVATGMGMDKRIGSQFLNAGIGFGGSCFPKDLRALACMAVEGDCYPQLLRTVLDINRDARHSFVNKLVHLLGDLEGITVGIWGLAFKPNTDDLREAPAIDIIRDLLTRGARVRAYDPVAMHGAMEALPGVAFCESAYEAAAGADAIALVTEWAEFAQIDLNLVKQTMIRPIIVDGRNVFDPDELARLGFTYHGVGVPTVRPKVELWPVEQSPYSPADSFSTNDYLSDEQPAL